MSRLPTVRAVRRVFWWAVVAGVSTEAAARAAGVSEICGRRWFADAGGMPSLCLAEPSSGRYLCLAEREQIAVGIAAGESLAAIAARLGRHRSTIGREVRRNSPARCRDRRGYRAVAAQQRADVRVSRPKPRKLATNLRLRAFVQAQLEQYWSPEQIAVRLVEQFPDEPEMWVSHEAIYQALYVQGRGGLRRELTRCLRTGRALRKPRRRVDGRTKRIPGMVMISDRPADAEDRAVPGHWEGDLIIGRNNASAIGTLVERTTRYVLLLHLPDGYDAVAVEQAMRATIGDLPRHLWRSLTWDQGLEMARHRELTVATDLPVYFCDPHSPWQRGSNENTNGLLRQYFPKGTDLSVHSATHLAAVAAQLNGRPRKTLDWHTPAEALNAVLSEPFDPPNVATTA